MNDLDLIRGQRPDKQLADAARLEPARGRLTDAIAAETGRTAVPGRRWPGGAVQWPARRARRRAVLAGLCVAVGVCVAAAAAGVTALLMAPGRTDHDAPAVRLTAAEFLDAAARAALRQPATPPRRGQWVLSVTEEQPGRKTLTWLPVTGNHDEVIRGFDHGSGGVGSACTVAQGERGFWYKPVTQHTPDGNITMYEVNPHEYVGQPHGYCIPDAGYFPDMPARARSLWAYLTRTHIVLLPSGQAAGLTQADRTNEVGRAVIDLVSDTYLLPAQRAGLFRLMASTAGFRVVPGVRDAIGRAGVAIEWHYMGFTSAIIFSPRTYAFLGDNAWSGGWSHGSDVSSGGTVLIEQKVVAAPPPDRQGG